MMTPLDEKYRGSGAHNLMWGPQGTRYIKFVADVRGSTKERTNCKNLECKLRYQSFTQHQRRVLAATFVVTDTHIFMATSL